MNEEETLKRLRRKKLYLLSVVMNGKDRFGNRFSKTIYAVNVDLQYPWSAAFTETKARAGAFTVRFLSALDRSRDRLKRAGWPETSYRKSRASKNHQSFINYLKTELSGKVKS